jgi:hypothetical protein
MTLCKVCQEKEAVFCEQCHGFTHKTRRQKFKQTLFKLKGYKCEMCGTKEKGVLTIHHTEIGSKANEAQYNPEKCKILCYNCHWGKIHRMKSDD